MRLLVYDPLYKGHHTEFLAHVLRFVVGKAREIEAIFLVHPRFKDRYPELVERSRATGRIRFRTRQVPEFSETNSGLRVAARSLREWCMVERAARRANVDHCLFMMMNPLQLPLAVRRWHPPSFRFHGILFHPYPRLEDEVTGGPQRLWRAITLVRKRWILDAVARNPYVGNIFVLNDRRVVRCLNRELGAGREPFVFLPDPVPRSMGNLDQVPGRSVGCRTPEAGKILIVTPGAIRRNKGILQALEAFRRLAPELCERVVYYVPGRIEDGLRDELLERLDRVRRERPNLAMRFDDRFLPEEEFEAAIRSADFLLLPYQRFEGSSGLLGHAARETVPVLGPSQGLVGELIDDYCLGLTTDPSNIEALTAALTDAITNVEDFRMGPGSDRYLEERTPEVFARTILENITGGSTAGGPSG